MILDSDKVRYFIVNIVVKCIKLHSFYHLLAYHLAYTYYIGVDNGAAGAAASAPIIWLVVVIQK